MAGSMSSIGQNRSRSPRVGVPFRTLSEEAAGKQNKINPYLRAVEASGGEPALISLRTPRGRLEELARVLDGFVLPGSPADVDPGWYHAPRHERCAVPDLHREQTDFTLVDVALAEGKPVLAICYGIQSLNVYLGGTLVQDIASELGTNLKHDWEGPKSGDPEPFHLVQLEPESRLAQLAGPAGGGTSAPEAQVNSSHHQAVQRPGRNLRVVACAPDGVIEAVEWTDDGSTQLTSGSHWVVGVQWHPERMVGDAFAAALFRAFIAACGKPASIRVKRA